MVLVALGATAPIPLRHEVQVSDGYEAKIKPRPAIVRSRVSCLEGRTAHTKYIPGTRHGNKLVTVLSCFLDPPKNNGTLKLHMDAPSVDTCVSLATSALIAYCDFLL